MSISPRPAGYTVVFCACGRPARASLLPALRETVRASTHGVLVTSGSRTRAAGPVLVVQPCDVDRRPVGCAVLVGPVRDEVDVADVTAWLRAGRLDPGRLPARLVAARAAAGN